MKIKDVIHYVLELQNESGKRFVFNQDIVEAINEAVKEQIYYKTREQLLDIKEALQKPVGGDLSER